MFNEVQMRNIANLVVAKDISTKLSVSDEPHVYDENLHQEYLELYRRCETDEILINEYRHVVILLHPFELIQTEVKSRLIPNSRPMKITNAFMKMWEFWKYIDVNELLPVKDTLRMFDIAGAPGMFVIATDMYLQLHYPKTKLDWYTCSLEGGTALTDQYKLYANNMDRYTPCDVLKEEDIERCMKYGKFDLVTGDIGIYTDDHHIELQELGQLDIEWGQMVLGLNLVNEHGVMILKMYSMVTYETLLLLDTLTQFFKSVRICKPYTSRILNCESYIICVDRNRKLCSDIPLKRPFIRGKYDSANRNIVETFEKDRLRMKYSALGMILKLLKPNAKLSYKEAKANPEYAKYISHFNKIYIELCNLRKVNSDS